MHHVGHLPRIIPPQLCWISTKWHGVKSQNNVTFLQGSMWSLTRFNKFPVKQVQLDWLWKVIHRVIKKSHNPFFETYYICQQQEYINVRKQTRCYSKCWKCLSLSAIQAFNLFLTCQCNLIQSFFRDVWNTHLRIMLQFKWCTSIAFVHIILKNCHVTTNTDDCRRLRTIFAFFNILHVPQSHIFQTSSLGRLFTRRIWNL